MSCLQKSFSADFGPTPAFGHPSTGGEPKILRNKML